MKIIVIFFFTITSLCSCTFNIKHVQQQFIDEDTSLNLDSLKTSILVANNIWNSRPWSKDYESEIFLNYILPPQIAYEPIEYYWRSDIPRWLNINYQGNDILELAGRINSKIDVDMRVEDWRNEQMGYTSTMQGNFGKCDDRAILTAMAMRSMGVPAAFEIIPMWGSVNNGHAFCSVITQENCIFTFQNPRDDGITSRFDNKVPKVYRKLFFEDTSLPTYQYRHTEDIPTIFTDFHLKDVTNLHKIGHRDISLKSSVQTDNHLCYLAVFHPNEWFPVAYGTIDNNDLNFRHIGTGIDTNGHNSIKGENIGNGILYLPIICDNGKIPATYPLIVSSDEIRILYPSEDTETVTLHRKYPKLERISKFAERMIGGVIEIATKADFSDAVKIHLIYECPLSRIQKIVLKEEKVFRYIRYRKPTGILSIAELIAYDSHGKIIPSTYIACEALKFETEIERIKDNDPLTFFEISNGLNLWVGLDFGRHTEVSSIGFCPRNDDNDICPGDKYELFYWDEKWNSLGEKRASSYELIYHNVPKNSLLWLRNKSKGKEERPFTYENNTQIWW